MTKQAQVGLLAFIAVLFLFGIFYVITDFGTRQSGYRVGIHFRSAAGLHAGAIVYFSGINVGTVDSIQLLPDNDVDVILAVDKNINIPAESKFVIQAPLTGDPQVLIVPPRAGEGESVTSLPRFVLPVPQQPLGQNSATMADLLQEGQGQIKRLDTILAELENREPKLLATLDRTLANVSNLTTTANRSVAMLALQASVASENIVALSKTLNQATQSSAPHVAAIIAQLDTASTSLSTSAQALQKLATNQHLSQSVIDTAANIAQTTKELAGIAKDLHSVTGDAQTQGQVRDSVANLDAATQRINAILGRFGGKSSVPGVDAHATPYPIVPRIPATGGGGGSGSPGTPLPLGTPFPLFRLHVRVSALGPQRVCCGTPLLTADRGPQTDLNLSLLPSGAMSLFVGANNVGAATTWNLAIRKRVGRSAYVGGGLLYSRLGLLAGMRQRYGGLGVRFYDPRYPTLDLYGHLRIAPGAQVFFGERALNHVTRRMVYGIETSW